MSRKLAIALFPSYPPDTIWHLTNLNEAAKRMNVKGLLDPAKQQELVEYVRETSYSDYSYGGYLEDRSTLWAGSYLPLDGMIHLGLDFNVNAGRMVHTPVEGRVVYANHDKDQGGGWGGRVDLYSEEFELYIIFGHLEPTVDLLNVGKVIPKNGSLSWIGDTPVNGGWFPHLHLQLVSKSEYESYSDPSKIDGYGKMTKNLRARYPHPALLTL